MVNVTPDELLYLLGSKEAENHALRRDNARLVELASELNQRLADVLTEGMPPGWKLVRVEN